MKKLFLCIALITGVSSAAFSVEEQWLSIGVNFGNYLGDGSAIDNFYMGSLGFNMSLYSFNEQKNIGAFVNFGTQFPALIDKGNDLSPVFQLEYIIGVGFRYNINEKSILHFGFGPCINSLALLKEVNENEKYSENRAGIGIGGDIGFKYDINDLVCINFGAALTCNFVNERTIRSTTDNWTNTKNDTTEFSDYSMFGIRPYFTVAFNYWYERGKWGKHKS